MWYCTIHFVSGKTNNVVFPDEEKANKFIKDIQNCNGKFDTLIYNNNNSAGIYINARNIEMITEPMEYKEDNISH
ncbi:hypothetical protein [Peribacillus sp. R9-11]|uniref:hypothetical protein n=1 Tax=Peribacillus sp. R9-11 TaxID=3073271 RepID=UPI0028687011|nr:hypothetical protein [Peribacillus sp. R9-11]WMX58515.1 hypothetical protein RE409_28795 [Peribacillus sp. R9-11]